MSGHHGKAEAAALLSLGSNLGKREETLLGAIDRLGRTAGLRLDAVSPLYETEPVDIETERLFVNAVCLVATELRPRDLLALCLAVEREFARTRGGSSRDRSLDVDLVAYGDREIHEPDLVVPHPRLRERRFVLVPLADVAPDFRLPPDGSTVLEVLRAYVGRGWVRRISSRGEAR